MIISMIAAVSKNRMIGSSGDLPWKISADLKYFKSKTKGHVIVMGRKTFESIGSKPLPHRYNIVISKSANENRQVLNSKPSRVENLVWLSSKNEVLEHCKELLSQSVLTLPAEIFICGGGKIYTQFLDSADRLYLTEVDLEVAGDTQFPVWSRERFVEISRDRQEENGIKFDFAIYEKNKLDVKMVGQPE
jgi:dihydrofolate reductase